MTYEETCRALVANQVTDIMAFINQDYANIKDLHQTAMILRDIGFPKIQNVDIQSILSSMPATPDWGQIGAQLREVMLQELEKQFTIMLLQRYGIFS